MPTIYNNDPKGVLNPVKPPPEGVSAEMDSFYEQLKAEALDRARAHVLSRLPADHRAYLMERIDDDFPAPDLNAKAGPQLVDSQAAVQAAAHQPAQEAADAKAEELADKPVVEAVAGEVHPTDLQPAPVQPPYPAAAMNESKPGEPAPAPVQPAPEPAPAPKPEPVQPAPAPKPEPDPSR